MDEEKHKKQFDQMTETLLGSMDQLLDRNNLKIFDKISEEIGASEKRLLKHLATKSEVQDHEQRLKELEAQVS